ncbi:hypothetical protein [Pararhodobacter zhoushanensis]|uniref:hypothetical protein n=1 Tax=Pararhodobacter zhoushanensis TaxID=2479545 RepID=UPI000F8D2709|nr:hypothetical protein [Pararhodobacter zhoushanensis]
MSRLTPEKMIEILTPALPQGETLEHCAYGIRQPNFLIVLPAFLLAILPGVILMQKLTKHLVVGTTQNSLVIAEIRPKWMALTFSVASVASTRVIPLAQVQDAQVKSGSLFTTIRFDHDSFKAKFHRAFSKVNRPEAIAIGAALTGAVP